MSNLSIYNKPVTRSMSKSAYESSSNANNVNTVNSIRNTTYYNITVSGFPQIPTTNLTLSVPRAADVSQTEVPIPQQRIVDRRVSVSEIPAPEIIVQTTTTTTTTTTRKRPSNAQLPGQASKKQKTNTEEVTLAKVSLLNAQFIAVCESFIEKKDYDSAIAIIEQNEVLSVLERVNLCNKLCCELFYAEEYQKCIDVISMAWPLIIGDNAINNEKADLLNKKYLSYYKLEQYSKAQQIVSRALLLANDVELKAKLYNNLSSVCNAQGNSISAIQAAERGLKFTTCSEAYKDALRANLALAEENLEKESEAILERARKEKGQDIIREVRLNVRLNVYGSRDSARSKAAQCIEDCEKSGKDLDAVLANAEKGLSLKLIKAEQKIELSRFMYDALLAKGDLQGILVIMRKVFHILNIYYNIDAKISSEWHVRRIHVYFIMGKLNHAMTKILEALDKFADIGGDSIGQLYSYKVRVYLKWGFPIKAKIAAEEGLAVPNLSEEVKTLLNSHLDEINDQIGPVPMTPLPSETPPSTPLMWSASGNTW